MGAGLRVLLTVGGLGQVHRYPSHQLDLVGPAVGNQVQVHQSLLCQETLLLAVVQQISGESKGFIEVDS